MLSRADFVKKLADFDEDDIDDLPPQNKKQLDQILRSLKEGTNLPPFTPQRIGSYGDDFINQIVEQTYKDTDEVIVLLEQCCFCQSKVHKHVLKKCKEMLDEFRKSVIDNSVDANEQRQRLFSLICALARAGIDNDFKLVKTAFLYFAQEIADFNSRIEVLQDLTLGALKEMRIIEFYDYNALIISDLYDMHRTGVLARLDDEQIVGMLNSSQAVDASLEYFGKLRAAVKRTFDTYQAMSKQLQNKSKTAGRERDPTRKDRILQVIKFGAQIMPIVQKFLSTCMYQQELDYFCILTEEEELNLGSTYYPSLYSPISVGNMQLSIENTNVLQSSFSSKAELQFPITDLAYHSINSTVRVFDRDAQLPKAEYENIKDCCLDYKKNIEFLLDYYNKQSQLLITRFVDLFELLRYEDQVERFTNCCIHQYMQQSEPTKPEVEYKFSFIVNSLYKVGANPKLLAYLVVLLFYNGITVYYNIANVSYKQFQDQTDLQTFQIGFLKEACLGETTADELIITHYFLQYRLISTMQYSKLLCELFNKFKKAADLSNNLELQHSIRCLVSSLELSGVQFMLEDADRFKYIIEKYALPSVQNFKTIHEREQNELSEYLYNKITRISEDYQDKFTSIEIQREKIDEEILKEKQLEFELQFKKRKFAKKERKFDRKEAQKEKTQKEQKFDDLNQSIFEFSLSNNVNEETYKSMANAVVRAFDEAVEATRQQSTEEGAAKATLSELKTKYSPELFRIIIHNLSIATFDNILFLLDYLLIENLGTKQMIEEFYVFIEQETGIKKLLLQLICLKIKPHDDENVKAEDLIKDAFELGYLLLRIGKPRTRKEAEYGYKAVCKDKNSDEAFGLLNLMARQLDCERAKQLCYFIAETTENDYLVSMLSQQFGDYQPQPVDLSAFPCKEEVQREAEEQKASLFKELEDID